MKEAKKKRIVNIITWVVLILLILVFAPWATIQALNVLLGLAIPFTIKTWVSVAWITLVYSWLSFVFVAAKISK
jgi:hypothetical protein